MQGVYRTRVGYTGGRSLDPTYRRMGDHSEALQIDYDPMQLSYEALIVAFFQGHRPTRPAWSRQYRSAIFVHNDEQRAIAEAVRDQVASELGQPIHTAIEGARTFYLAEDYHQKYSLQSQHRLMKALKQSYHDFADIVDSTAAARLNGYVSGYGELAALQAELPSLGLDEKQQQQLLKQFKRF